MTELNHLSLGEMQKGLRARQFTPRELMDCHLAEIEARRDLNAFVAVYAEEALAAAEAAGEAFRPGRSARPLEGIPVSVKDSFDIAGQPTWCGSLLRRHHRAERDATAVSRLREAGAIVIGKTNCPEFLMNYETDNHICGRTNHPLDAARTAGGSSGGEAAAISSYCSAGGMGSDGGGSIREPAHFCGIAGLKPTPGRVPASGHFPPICHPGGLLGVAGPMARSVADVRALFEIVEGYDRADPFSVPRVGAGNPGQPLRVAVMEQFFDIPVEPAISAGVREAARRLEAAGIPVVEALPASLSPAPDLWWFFFGRVNALLLGAAMAGNEEITHWTGVELKNMAEREPPPTALELLHRLAARDALRAAVLAEMEALPVVLLPACGVTAFPHRQRLFATPTREITLLEAMAPLTPFNLFGFPALTVPVSKSAEGFPVGVQLAGRPWEEELLLDLGELIERSA